VTVIVGFLGADGAVMASDSQASEQDNTRYDAPKIWEENGVLLGYSGNTAVLDPIQLALQQRLEGKDPSASRWMMKVHLCEAIRPVLVGEEGCQVANPEYLNSGDIRPRPTPTTVLMTLRRRRDPRLGKCQVLVS
jgi:hypothetical protein